MEAINGLLTPVIGKFVIIGWCAYSLVAFIVTAVMASRVGDPYISFCFGVGRVTTLAFVIISIVATGALVALAYMQIFPQFRKFFVHGAAFSFGMVLVLAFSYAAVNGSSADYRDGEVVAAYGAQYEITQTGANSDAAQKASKWFRDWLADHTRNGDVSQARDDYTASRTKEIGNAMIGTFVVYLLLTAVAYYIVYRGDTFSGETVADDEPADAEGKAAGSSPADPYGSPPQPNPGMPGTYAAQPQYAPPPQPNPGMPSYDAQPQYAPPPQPNPGMPSYDGQPQYAPPPPYAPPPAYGGAGSYEPPPYNAPPTGSSQPPPYNAPPTGGYQPPPYDAPPAANYAPPPEYAAVPDYGEEVAADEPEQDEPDDDDDDDDDDADDGD
jgi:hypothetical protein